MDRYLAVEIGGTKLQVALGDGEANVLERRRMRAERDRGAGRIREQVCAAVDELTHEAKPDGVGVGFGGPVDRHTGRVAMSYQVEGWSEFPIRRWFEELVGAPAAVDNDCNVAALGEAVKGAGGEFDKVFYVTLGSGMGGGMVSGGELYHGAAPGEAEVGLNYYSKDGTTVESRCCGWAVDGKIRRHVAREPDGALARLVGDAMEGEARFLRPALEAGDPAARRILRETAEDIAFGVSHAVHMFNPEVLVIGGGLAGVGEPLRAAVAEFLPGMLTEAFRPGPQVRLTALGRDVVLVGGLLLAARAAAGNL